MFTVNCTVQHHTSLARAAPGNAGGGGGEEKLHPVVCSFCGAQVGVYDEEEEIYHFYEVLEG